MKILSLHPLPSLGFFGPKDDLDLVPAVALPFTHAAEAVSQEPLPSKGFLLPPKDFRVTLGGLGRGSVCSACFGNKHFCFSLPHGWCS